MPRLFSTHGLAAALLSAAFSTTAVADDFSDYAALSARFTQLAGARGSKAAPPEESKAELASIAAKLADHRRFLGKRRFTVDTFEPLMVMCVAGAEVLGTYLDFGLVDALGKNENALLGMMKTNLLTEKNMSLYQQQTAPLLVFLNKCNVSLVETSRDFLPANIAEVNEGMRELVLHWRTNFSAQFAILSKDASENLISPENLQAIYSSIAEAAPVYVQLMDQPTRMRLHSQLSKRQTAALPAPFRTMYEQILNALQNQPCERMCLL